MRKVRHDKRFALEHNGNRWTVDLAEWRDEKTGRGELRVYRIEGDINSPDLDDALALEADSRALAWQMKSNRIESNPKSNRIESKRESN